MLCFFVMRYLLLVLLLGFGILALYRGFGADRSEEAPALRTEEEADEPASRPAGDALESLARPRSSDMLARSLGGILGDLVHGRLGADDRDELEARILEALADEKLSDAVTMASAARSTAERLLEEMRKARGQGAAALPEGQTQVVIQAMAGQLAGKLRRALAQRGDGKPHEGSFFTVGLDFEPPEGYRKVSWDTLGGFDYREGMELPEAVLELQGQKVAVAGYMMAIGEFEDIHVFALVESQWSCCFGIPPDLNQIITATIPDLEDGIELVAQPILVYGRLEAGEEREDDWVINVYRVEVAGVEILDAR